MKLQKPKYQRPHWIFFDLDDTLWNFNRNSMESLYELYEISPILKKLFKSFEELSDEYHRHNSYLWAALERKEITTAQLKVERWRRTLASRQFEVLTAVCEELDRNYLEILASNPRVMDGALEVLSRLSSRFLIGVISNGFSATQYKKLRASGLNKFVTRLIVSDEIEKPKPQKEVFDYAINATGAVPPYIMVGDSLHGDVAGALNAGWYALLIDADKKTNFFIKNELIAKGVDPSHFLGRISSLTEGESIIKSFFH